MSCKLLLSLAVLAVLTGSCLCGIRASNVCSDADALTAAFQTNANKVVDSPMTLAPDAGLKFLRNIMLFSDKEIEEFTEDAIEFFNERFGLDFSAVEADENGTRYLAEKNATLTLFELNPDLDYHVVFNKWLTTGRQTSLCFDNRQGGYSVSVGSEQMLFGTYGGEEGRPIQPGDFINYAFANIAVCPQSPIIIRFQSRSPIRFGIDGFGTVDCDVFHRKLGQGVSQALLGVVPTGDNRVYVTLRGVFVFPDPGLQ